MFQDKEKCLLRRITDKKYSKVYLKPHVLKGYVITGRTFSEFKDACSKYVFASVISLSSVCVLLLHYPILFTSSVTQRSVFWIKPGFSQK